MVVEEEQPLFREKILRFWPGERSLICLDMYSCRLDSSSFFCVGGEVGCDERFCRLVFCSRVIGILLQHQPCSLKLNIRGGEGK